MPLIVLPASGPLLRTASSSLGLRAGLSSSVPSMGSSSPVRVYWLPLTVSLIFLASSSGAATPPRSTETVDQVPWSLFRSSLPAPPFGTSAAASRPAARTSNPCSFMIGLPRLARRVPRGPRPPRCRGRLRGSRPRELSYSRVPTGSSPRGGFFLHRPHGG